MLVLMSKMYPTERRPIEFAKKDLKRTWKKIEKEPLDEDNDQASDIDEEKREAKDTVSELDFTTSRFPSDADWDEA